MGTQGAAGRFQRFPGAKSDASAVSGAQHRGRAEMLQIHADGMTAWATTPAPKPARVISAYLDPVLVEPGSYTALYAGHRGLEVFRSRKLQVLWQLTEHPDLCLPRYYRVACYKPRIIAPASSDIMREVSAVLGPRIRRDQIPVASLGGIPARVIVETVTVDHHQRELAEVNRYSIIRSVEGPA